jgi:hypothetical protein
MLDLVPVSVLYLSAAVPAFLVTCGAAVNVLDMTRHAARSALVLSLVLAASLMPGTVSHLLDGSRFEFRRPLHEVQQRDPGATVLVYPVIHARWESPDLDAVEFRPDLGVPFLDSLRAARDEFWIVAPLRRMGLVGDGDGAKLRWIQRYCELERAYRHPRFDFERYDTQLYRCSRVPAAP